MKRDSTWSRPQSTHSRAFLKEREKKKKRNDRLLLRKKRPSPGLTQKSRGPEKPYTCYDFKLSSHGSVTTRRVSSNLPLFLLLHHPELQWINICHYGTMKMTPWKNNLMSSWSQLSLQINHGCAKAIIQRRSFDSGCVQLKRWTEEYGKCSRPMQQIGEKHLIARRSRVQIPARR